ncbi:MAG TPA: hypothetical protein VLS49_01215 [Usitatibacter sp.]|nr:hypothetical protein [Usitatibacter sp.]
MRAKFLEAPMNADPTPIAAEGVKTMDAWRLAWIQGPGDSGFLSAFVSALIGVGSALIGAFRGNREQAK